MQAAVDITVYQRNPVGYDSFQSFFLSDPDTSAVRMYRRLFEEASLAGGQRVLEIGIGTGLNLARYPERVDLWGVDISDEMLALAHARASELGRRATLTRGDAAELAHQDDSFDRVVCTFVVCSCSAPGDVLREALRVCRPGGRVALFDYHRADRDPKLIGDQHFMRETMLNGIIFDGQRVAVCDPLYQLEPNLPDGGWDVAFDERCHESLSSSFRATVLTKR